MEYYFIKIMFSRKKKNKKLEKLEEKKEKWLKNSKKNFFTGLELVMELDLEFYKFLK